MNRIIKFAKRRVLLVLIMVIIFVSLGFENLRNWIFTDLEHALVFISVVFPILNLLATRNLKRVDLRHDYLKIIHEKRVNSYPQLHILTDGLGTLCRSKCVKVLQLEHYLQKFAEWDANNAIFSGDETTNHLYRLRRTLETYIDESKDCVGENCNSLLFQLECLEYNMKKELKVLLESDLKDEPMLGHRDYDRNIHK